MWIAIEVDDSQRDAVRMCMEWIQARAHLSESEIMLITTPRALGQFAPAELVTALAVRVMQMQVGRSCPQDEEGWQADIGASVIPPGDGTR